MNVCTLLSGGNLCQWITIVSSRGGRRGSVQSTVVRYLSYASWSIIASSCLRSVSSSSTSQPEGKIPIGDQSVRL